MSYNVPESVKKDQERHFYKNGNFFDLSTVWKETVE